MVLSHHDGHADHHPSRPPSDLIPPPSLLLFLCLRLYPLYLITTPPFPTPTSNHHSRLSLSPLLSTIQFYICCFCASICLTINKDESRNRSTQFSRHDASPRENLVDMPPVMHLFQPVGSVSGISLVTVNSEYGHTPAH